MECRSSPLESFMARKASLLQNVFNRRKGWDIPSDEIEVSRHEFEGGTVVFTLDVGGLQVQAIQVDADNLLYSVVKVYKVCLFYYFSGLPWSAVEEGAETLLEFHNITNGLPAFALDEDGELSLQSAFLVPGDLPIEITRSMLLMHVGQMIEVASAFWGNYTDDEDCTNDVQNHGISQSGWETARKALSLTFEALRAYNSFDE